MKDEKNIYSITIFSDENEFFFFQLLDVVDDVYQLGECIKRGRTDEAVDLAKKLSKQRVRLEAKLQDNPREEKSIRYVKNCFFSIKLLLIF